MKKIVAVILAAVIICSCFTAGAVRLNKVYAANVSGSDIVPAQLDKAEKAKEEAVQDTAEETEAVEEIAAVEEAEAVDDTEVVEEAERDEEKPRLSSSDALPVLSIADIAVPELNMADGSDDTPSGQVGTCNWEINADGRLTISPADGVSGAMPSITKLADIPWYSVKDQIKSVVIEPGVKTGEMVKGLFGYLYNCTSMDLANLDTSSTTSISYMFYSSSAVTSLDLSNFNTSNVTDMSYMFSDCQNLERLDLSSFDTSKVTNMSFMFNNCKKLDGMDVSAFDTSNVTNMRYMFSYCSAMSSIDVSDWDVSKVTNAERLFYSCNVASFDLSRWDVSSLKNAGLMFADCSALTTVGDISRWNTASLEKAPSMFYGCSNLASLDLSGWNTSKLKDMSSMFSFSRSLTSVGDISHWDTSNVTDMTSTFRCCYALLPPDLSGWDTSKVRSFENTFGSCDAFTTLDLSGWDTSSATTLRSMFSGCNSLTEIKGLGGFNTSNVTDMYQTFYKCSAMPTFDVSGWDTSNVTNTSGMFHTCKSITELDLSSWDMSKVTNTSEMFYYCSALERLNIDGWNTSNVTNMNNMFEYCTLLSDIDLSNLDIGKVTTAIGLFRYCNALTELDLTNWAASASAKNLGAMFTGCTAVRRIAVSSKWQKANTKCTNANSFNISYGDDGMTVYYYPNESAAKMSVKSVTVNNGDIINVDLAQYPQSYTVSDYNDDTTVTITYDYRYDVTFVDTDGTTIEVQKVFNGEDATAPNVARYPQPAYTITWSAPLTNITADKTIAIASVAETTYTVTFDNDGDIGTVTVLHGGKVSRPDDPEKEGFEFTGWLLNGELYDFDSAVTEDITLTADWLDPLAGVPLGMSDDIPMGDDDDDDVIAPRTGESSSEAPRTGDDGSTVLMAFIGLISLAAMAATAVTTAVKKRKCR